MIDYGVEFIEIICIGMVLVGPLLKFPYKNTHFFEKNQTFFNKKFGYSKN